MLTTKDKLLSAYKSGGDDMCDTFIELIEKQMMLRVEAIELGDLRALLLVYKQTNNELSVNSVAGNTDNQVKH